MDQNIGANAPGVEANATTAEPVKPETTTEANASSPDVNARLLEESKKHKARYQETKKQLEELQAKLDAQKQNELAEQGKYKDLWQKEREQNETFRKRYVEEKIRSAVETAALRAGIVDPTDAFLLGNMDLIQFDPESHSIDGADTLVEDLKKRKAHLFKGKTQMIVNSSVPATHQEKPKGLMEMTLTEQLEVFKKQRMAGYK